MSSDSLVQTWNMKLIWLCSSSCWTRHSRLLVQDVRAANVRALSDSLVLTCHRNDFQTHLGNLTDIRRLWRFEALRKVSLHKPPFFHSLPLPVTACDRVSFPLAFFLACLSRWQHMALKACDAACQVTNLSGSRQP